MPMAGPGIAPSCLIRGSRLRAAAGDAVAAAPKRIAPVVLAQPWGYSSPENRSHADCRVIWRAAPMRAQVTLRSRKMVTSR